jgi:hypothetical protein
VISELKGRERNGVIAFPGLRMIRIPPVQKSGRTWTTSKQDLLSWQRCESRRLWRKGLKFLQGGIRQHWQERLRRLARKVSLKEELITFLAND